MGLGVMELADRMEPAFRVVCIHISGLIIGMRGSIASAG